MTYREAPCTLRKRLVAGTEPELGRGGRSSGVAADPAIVAPAYCSIHRCAATGLAVHRRYWTWKCCGC